MPAIVGRGGCAVDSIGGSVRTSSRLVAGVVGRLGKRLLPAALVHVAAFGSRAARSTGHQRRINDVGLWVECERPGGVHCSWLSRVAP